MQLSSLPARNVWSSEQGHNCSLVPHASIRSMKGSGYESIASVTAALITSLTTPTAGLEEFSVDNGLPFVTEAFMFTSLPQQAVGAIALKECGVDNGYPFLTAAFDTSLTAKLEKSGVDDGLLVTETFMFTSLTVPIVGWIALEEEGLTKPNAVAKASEEGLWEMKIITLPSFSAA